jgi:hypothetical protein
MMMRNQTKSFQNLAAQFFRQYCCDSGDSGFFWHAGLQAAGLSIQPLGRRQSHRLNRDEEGE